MQTYVVFIVLLILTYFGYRIGSNRAITASEGRLSSLHSLPAYHGLYITIWCGIPSIFLVSLWTVAESFTVTALIVSELPENLRNQPEGDTENRKTEH